MCIAVLQEEFMENQCRGVFTELDGEEFYKIENYDRMDDFFMTITSSSDIWNFCWSKGGISAGRKDSNHAVFPYYTADKISDAKFRTGPYTAIAVSTKKSGQQNETEIWEPFSDPGPAQSANRRKSTERNIYKNSTGTKIWFEEKNLELGLTFRYGWTSSEKFGIVRNVLIQNNSDAPVKLAVLDGCRNILPACVTSDFQNANSILLDAYKKTEMIRDVNLALFSVSSIVTDKAEPNEGLYANIGWFSTDDRLILSPDAPEKFALAVQDGIQSVAQKMSYPETIKGGRPACFICRTISLNPAGTDGSSDNWIQIFDTEKDASEVADIARRLTDRKGLRNEAVKDIADGEERMRSLISAADGIQHTADKMTALHHEANVMFNIMRGGIPADGGFIDKNDFLDFVRIRNRKLVAEAKNLCAEFGDKTEPEIFLESATAAKNPQLVRLAYEYVPLTFSRRHGDPSRPWNKFSIKLRNSDGSPVLNYEGNWRDIFQNWEALAWSYPVFAKNFCMKFLNAITPDGFNPYRITRNGIEWEEPDPDNPWAQIGYWGDHQVIYLAKLLEFLDMTDSEGLVSMLGLKVCSTANVPYRLKSYSEILADPRNSIIFDRKLSDRLKSASEENGTDEKLVKGKDDMPHLSSATAKILQIINAKAANFIPGGGIWMNTQRPEWNDANNALAGYGLSVVTLCYLHRFLCFLERIYAGAGKSFFAVPVEISECFSGLGEIFASVSPQTAAGSDSARREFADRAEKTFEKEREILYRNGFSGTDKEFTGAEIAEILGHIKRHLAESIRMNRRKDGLFHSYNTVRISDREMKISELQIMLEGQVAVLSSGILTAEESISLLQNLKSSPLYDRTRNSYMLYPDRELPHFCLKNRIAETDTEFAAQTEKKYGGKIISRDCNGIFHFNADFRNAGVLKEFISAMTGSSVPGPDETGKILELYEKTFLHQNFTGRSGTFYAYEGLGSIYWHMVAKLLLAVQENTLHASGDEQKKLEEIYYDIRGGIGYNKTPAEYGAFPADPYSHTPSGQGAKQPGMTGQVKEEILTRWGELGIRISGGKAEFRPMILSDSEFMADGTMEFTWCGTRIVYRKNSGTDVGSLKIEFADGTQNELPGDTLVLTDTRQLLARNGKIRCITVTPGKN